MYDPRTSNSPSPFRSNRDGERERKQKREALLLAAVRMFNERGFHATSLEDVAASLGVTKPVIYHHLGNKEKVLLECVRIGLHELQLVARQSRQEPGSGFDRLRSFLRRYAEVIMDDFGKCLIRTGDELLSPEGRKKFRGLKGEVDSAMREIIVEAVADGSAIVHDVRLTAFAFAGALNWPARWFEADGALTSREVADGLVEILCAGIDPNHNCVRETPARESSAGTAAPEHDDS
ncbi:MAG: TetR/AcrR family transcriptional regulator [Sphingomonas sp.]